MGFGKKSSKKESDTTQATVTQVEARPTDAIQRAAIDRADTADSPQLLSGASATEDEEARRRSQAGLLG